MAWSNKQKANVVRACKAQGIDDQRKLILGHLDGRAKYRGEITSRSPQLTQADYEQTMATIETFSGGQIKTKTRDGKHVYRFGHWAGRVNNAPLARQKDLIGRLINTLVVTPDGEGGRALDVDGHLLAGVILKATNQRADAVEVLDASEAKNVIDALKAIGKRHGVNWNSDLPAA